MNKCCMSNLSMMITENVKSRRIITRFGQSIPGDGYLRRLLKIGAISGRLSIERRKKKGKIPAKTLAWFQDR